MPRRLALAFLAVVLLVGAAVGAFTLAQAATSSQNLAAGDTLNVHCLGPSLQVVQNGVDATLTCAPNPTTTTAAPTTTTRPPTGVDLVVTAVTPVPAAPTAGQAVNFQITMKNQGTVASPANIGAGLTVDGVGGRWIGPTAALAPGASVTRDTCTDSCWNAPNWTATNGTHTVTATADDSQKVAESNETNNARSITLQVGAGTTTTTAAPTTTTAAPTTTTTTPTTTTTTQAPPSGRFQVNSAGRTISPTGQSWVATGANLGTPCSFGDNGNAIGHSTDAQTWGWKVIRLDVAFFTQRAFGCQVDIYADVQAVINEYTAKGIVVQVQGFDLTLGTASQDEALAAIAQVAATNKTNPNVWYDCYNEPGFGGSNYDVQQNRCTDAIRNAGATAPIVMDAQNSANDASWDGVPPGATYDHCPTVKAHDPLHNVVMSLHNYGGHPDNAELSGYFDQVRAAGCDIEVGEYGYTVSSPDPANVAGAQASMAVAPGKSVSLIVWHGTHNDCFALRTDCGSFYGTAALSDLGQRVWNLTH